MRDACRLYRIWHFLLYVFFSCKLQQLRVARRQTVEQHLRKDLSLQIRQIHRQELKQWKSNQLNAFLGNPSRWKDLRDYLLRPSGRRSVMYPHLDDFASMLEALFVGPCQPLQRPMRLTEPGWDLSELRFAVQRLKTGKCVDELGLTAELLKHAPEEFLNTLLTLYNNVLVTGERPESWCKTLFSMLPKKTKPLQPADFRPIANIRLLYKTFAYLLLGRLEQFLEAGQPEEQHGFRPGRRLEEHLVTANLVLDKADAVGIPVWIISLDLSKAFDRVHWPALWTALVDEGIPVHLVWILQCVYFGQCGEVVGDMGQNSKFNITGGVRQGCVLSPRLFCSVLPWAMREWRAEVGNVGFNLMDGGPNLLDLRFADDILVFGRSRVEAGNLLDALVKHLDRVGLLLNTDKTVVITNEAQPPQTFATTAEVILRVLPHDAGQKWLGSMLTSRGSKLQDVDVQYHLQQASKVFHMNRWILQDRNVSIVKRLRYFESVVSSVACFAGGHRTMYNRHLERLGTHFRKLCRSIVGPPPGTDWTLEWHEILHQWNVRMNIFLDRANIKTWSHICCLSYWRLAQHIATLPQERWIRRILRWCPAGRHRTGRPHFHWESKLESYRRYKGLGRWIEAAMNRDVWDQHCKSFIEFCCT